MLKNNPTFTLIQLEQALNNLQNTMVDENGKFTLDDKYLEIFDQLMEKLKQTRQIAQSLKDK